MLQIAGVLLLVCLALILVAAGIVVRSMFMATRGRKIGRYLTPGKALVVLDLQEGGGPGVRPEAPATTGYFGTVNRLIESAATRGFEIAYLRQVFDCDWVVRMHGGKPQGRVVLDRRLLVVNENDFEKKRTDGFASREFERFLIDRQVEELYLVGVDAAYCVYYTALGALQRGYRVTVIEDAVRSRRKMPEVLERYRRKGIGIVSGDLFLRAK